MKQEIGSTWENVSKKQESTRKEIFYLTNEFGLCFIDHGKLVKYFKQEAQAD